MSKRVTIVLSDAGNKKLRLLHAKLIPQVSKSLSFSKVIEEVALTGLDNININQMIKNLEKKI